jgi:Protein of unknown function (DUF1552)
MSRAFPPNDVSPPQKPLSRRQFLRSGTAVLALPFLEALAPRVVRGQSTAPAKRMVCIMTNTGLLPGHFFPKETGRDYEPSRYLTHLESVRGRYTVMNGLSHPDNSGGHVVEKSFLTGARFPASSTFKNSISLDQLAAESFGHHTRFPFIALGVNGQHDGLLSVSRDGVFIPPELSPAKVYRRLFTPDTAEESEERMREIGRRISALDFVNEKAQRLARALGAEDRSRLDQYLTSVRELEMRLEQARVWQQREKPNMSRPAPQDITDNTQDVDRARLMYDMAQLALQSDSTRVITLYLNPLEVTVKVPGVSDRTHSLTHHGNEPEKLDQLARVEEAGMKNLGRFLWQLAGVNEGAGSLLDETAVLFGSNMSNGSNHSNVNLPVLLAGGGFKHGQHLQFDLKNNTPLCNLFASILQHMGMETERFSTGTGTLSGLELA